MTTATSHTRRINDDRMHSVVTGPAIWYRTTIANVELLLWVMLRLMLLMMRVLLRLNLLNLLPLLVCHLPWRTLMHHKHLAVRRIPPAI